MISIQGDQSELFPEITVKKLLTTPGLLPSDSTLEKVTLPHRARSLPVPEHATSVAGSGEASSSGVQAQSPGSPATSATNQQKISLFRQEVPLGKMNLNRSLLVYQRFCSSR